MMRMRLMMRLVVILSNLVPVDRQHVSLQNVILRKGLPAPLATVVPLFQVDRHDVPLEDVAL